MFNFVPFKKYIQYHNWIVTIFLYDDKKVAAHGKADNDDSAADQGDKTVDTQVCDVKVLL